MSESSTVTDETEAFREGDDCSAPTLPEVRSDVASLDDPVIQADTNEAFPKAIELDRDDHEGLIGACGDNNEKANGETSANDCKNADANTLSFAEDGLSALDKDVESDDCQEATIREARFGPDAFKDVEDQKNAKVAANKDFAEKPKRSILRVVWRIFVTIISAFFLILTANWVTVSQEWDQIFKSPAFFNQRFSASNWEGTIESGIRLHESKSYVESIMGVPKTCEVKEFGEGNTKYETTAYVNPHYSLFCVYIDETLKGFLVISNSEFFRPENYRIDISLLDDTIASASEKCNANAMHNVCIGANYSYTGRLDGNAYYMECKVQHSAGGCEDALVGYGVTDIGLWDRKQSIAKLLNEDIGAYPGLWETGIMNSSYYRDALARFEDHASEVRAVTGNANLAIRQQKINAFFVFDADNGVGVNLLRSSLMTNGYLGMNKDRYASFNPDYPISYKNYRRNDQTSASMK